MVAIRDEKEKKEILIACNYFIRTLFGQPKEDLSHKASRELLYRRASAINILCAS